MDQAWVLVGVAVGLLAGALAVWLGMRGRLGPAEERLANAEKYASELKEDTIQLQLRCRDLETSLSTERKVLIEAETAFKDAFKNLSNDIVEANRKKMISTAENVLKQYKDAADLDTSARKQEIDQLVKPLSDALKGYDKKVQDMNVSIAASEATTKTRIDQLLGELSQQRTATQDLKNILKGPTSRGKVGEMFLKRLLDAAGLTEGLHYQLQRSEETASGRARPDCVVRLPSGRALIIDSKTPMSSYEAALELDDEAQRTIKFKDHARSVRGEIDRLAKRPYDDPSFETDFVVMFFPIEMSLHAALQSDPELVSYGWDRQIIVTSPTLLYALIQIAALDWRQEEVRKNSQEIRDLGQEMVNRIRIVADHVRKAGAGLATALTNHNKAVDSMNRNLLTTASRFQKLGAGKRDPIVLLPERDAGVADFSKPELLAPPLESETKSLMDLDEELEPAPLNGAVVILEEVEMNEIDQLSHPNDAS